MADLEPIVGRYLRLSLGGQPHRVYFEEAGQGWPLLCLHTAGADGRQFRHLMTDPAVTRHWRVLAFDMPRHGKSLPPVGWQDGEYRLTTAAYVEMILGFADALALDRPVVLGCSIGGKIVLELALRAPERFRALIGLEAAAHQAPWYDDTSWLHRPDVHGGELASALMSGLIAPQAPDESRWETLWMYAQSGPGVFRGDLHFYRVEGDLRDRVDQVDTARCPLYPPDGRVRLLLHARGHPRDRGPHPRRPAHHHEGARALPDERAPRALPHVPPARPGGDPRGQPLTSERSPAVVDSNS